MSDRFVTAAPSRRASTAMKRPARTKTAVHQLRLLNGFELLHVGAPVRLPQSAQRLVAFLGLHDQPQLRVRIACVLWTDMSEERAFACLRSSLWRVNRLGSGVIQCSGSRLALTPDVEIDLRGATESARELLHESGSSDPHAAVDALLDAELLPDWYEDWVELERERFRQLRLHALEAACARYTAEGEYGAAVGCGLAAVSADPLRESAHRAVIRAHLAEGNIHEALRQYRSCRRLLRQGLGVAPSRALEELVERARNGGNGSPRA
jgi:DNA-binding SARP family transcriptional activator